MSSIAAMVALASELPDPGAPWVVGVCGAAGTVLGGLISRIWRMPDDRISQITGTGTWIGLGTGFAIWFAAIAIDRL